MKWEDISKHLPGRSAISCRLHYQNYLERRSEWDEDRKNKLARLYERYVEQRRTESRSTVKTLYQRGLNLVADPNRLPSRFRADMWARVAEEMAMPWRAVEAMHWQMGEHEMAKRAGVTPFSLNNSSSNHYDSGNLGPRSHLRHIGPGPRLRRESMPPDVPYQGPPQLPSLAELTAGLPAYAAAPPYQSSDPFHHHLYNHPKGRNASFR